MTTPPVAASQRTRRMWDVVLAVVLLLLLVVFAVIAGYAGAFLAMASDPCGGTTVCSEERLSLGVLVAMIGPAVVAVVAIVSVVERLVRARLAFWPPLAGFAAAAAVWAGGAALVFSAVPS